MFTLFEYFIAQPALALIPAAVFAGLALASRSRAAGATAAAWAIYALMEAGNKAGLTCSGECNIRADLLLIAPALLGLSAFALIRVALRLFRKRPA